MERCEEQRGNDPTTDDANAYYGCKCWRFCSQLGDIFETPEMDEFRRLLGITRSYRAYLDDGTTVMLPPSRLPGEIPVSAGRRMERSFFWR